MTITGRIFTLIIVVSVLAALLVSRGREPEEPPPILDHRSQHNVSLALDKALQEWVSQLFSVWMRDATGQPERAITGIDKAVTSYYQMRNRIGLEPVPRVHLKQLVTDALEDAVRAYFVKLFSGWMRKTGGHPDTTYEKEMNEALRAYVDARDAVEKNW